MSKESYKLYKTLCIVFFFLLGVAFAVDTKADDITFIAGGGSYHLETRTFESGGKEYDINEVNPAAGLRFGFDSDDSAINHGYVAAVIIENSFNETSFCGLYNPRIPVTQFVFAGARLGLCTGYSQVSSSGIAPIAALEVGIELLDNTYIVFGAQLPEVATFHMEYKF